MKKKLLKKLMVLAQISLPSRTLWTEAGSWLPQAA